MPLEDFKKTNPTKKDWRLVVLPVRIISSVSLQSFLESSVYRMHFEYIYFHALNSKRLSILFVNAFFIAYEAQIGYFLLDYNFLEEKFMHFHKLKKSKDTLKFKHSNFF